METETTGQPEPQKAQIKGHGTLTAKFNGEVVSGKVLEGINKLNAEHEAKNARLIEALEEIKEAWNMEKMWELANEAIKENK